MLEHATDREEDPERDNVIHEDNWFEYEVLGFFPILRGTREEVEEYFGPHNVYTGDTWDREAGRPLRHKPGGSMYSNNDGRDYAFEQWRLAREAERHRQESSSGGPASS
jgi:hypothetical protein